MSGDVYSVIRDGRYSCPVCRHRTHSLAEKKAHIHEAHPRPKKGGRR